MIGRDCGTVCLLPEWGICEDSYTGGNQTRERKLLVCAREPLVIVYHRSWAKIARTTWNLHSNYLRIFGNQTPRTDRRRKRGVDHRQHSFVFSHFQLRLLSFLSLDPVPLILDRIDRFAMTETGKSPTENTPELLLDRLHNNATQHPDQPAVSFYGPGPKGGQLIGQFTYAEFARVTDILATELLSKYVGQRVVLVYPPGLSFLVAFVSCLKANVVAVPVFPPHPARKDTLSLFSTICATAECTTVLTDSTYQHQKQMVAVQERLQVWKKSGGSRTVQWPEHLEWVVTDSFLKNRSSKKAPSKPPPVTDPTQLAFLQFTSGSTSSPKGVQITHSNLAHNLRLIVSQLEADRSTVVVSWLPMYHDMGLIGSFLGCLYCGGTGHYLSPLTFLQRPAIWLEAVERHGGTHLQTPNFALALTARKLQQGGAPNLSTVRHVINAAEPVTEAAVDAFLQAVPSLDPNVMFPTYGLAEHTVMVCTNGRQRLRVDKQALEVERRVVVLDGEDKVTKEDAAATVLMGCGVPVIDVRIVDTQTETEVGEDAVGEIWVSSGSKANGYYGQPEASERDFGAELPDNNSTKYLRTGDLGFKHAEEVFVCGRIKDLIIVGGRNYYPQDLEMTAEGVGGNAVRPGCSAAFEYGEDSIGLVMELRDTSNQVEATCEDLATRIRGTIQKDHAVGIAVISFLKTRSVPKTSSGKIARAKCRAGFLAKTLEEVHRKTFAIESTTTIEPLEIEPSSPNGAPSGPRIQRDAATVRAMSKDDIKKSLLDDLSKLGSVPPDAIDPKAALISMLDSLSLSQFKGLLENGYKIRPLSDEYLFRETTSVLKLVEVIKLGHAPDDDGADGTTANGGAGGAEVAGIGQARGLAGALGCPPGVVCTIQ